MQRAPHLPQDMLRAAQAAPHAGWRAAVLAARLPHLVGADPAAVLAQALAAAPAKHDPWRRASGPRALAPHLARQAMGEDLVRTRRALAARGRLDLLRDRTALQPWPSPA